MLKKGDICFIFSSARVEESEAAVRDMTPGIIIRGPCCASSCSISCPPPQGTKTRERHTEEPGGDNHLLWHELFETKPTTSLPSLSALDLFTLQSNPLLHATLGRYSRFLAANSHAGR